MIEISFQNKLDDIKAFEDYMARASDEGKRIGNEMVRYMQSRILNYSIMMGLFIWGVSKSFIAGIILIFISILLGEAVFFLRANFEPRYYYAKQVYEKQNKYITDRQRKLFVLPRKLAATEEFIEISSSMSLRRCNWVCVEKIDTSSDFIFVHIGGCPITYLPKRDFPSERDFREFGLQLDRYRQEVESKNISVPS